MELGKLSRQTNKLWPPATAAYSSPAPRHRENPDWNGRGWRETVGEDGFTNRGKAYDLEDRGLILVVRVVIDDPYEIGDN